MKTINLENKKAVIFAEGEFTKGFAKTAKGILKYGKYDILGVIDSTQKGELIDGKIPFLSALEEVLDQKPDIFILGIAPRGGKIPESWRNSIKEAMNHGLDIFNGLHLFFNEDPELKNLAKENNVKIWDSRSYPNDLEVATGLTKDIAGKVVLTVGTDCAIGKMSTSYELHREAKKRGLNSIFIPTGQTAIMIEGFGISVDAVPGDFMAGACERVLLDYGKDYDYIFVEGQGSIFHLGYSSTTIAMLHGFMPTHLILCHEPTRKFIKDTIYPIRDILKTIKCYEELTPDFRKAKTYGIGLNTSKMTEREALDSISYYQDLAKLPTDDCVRFSASKILDSIVK